MTAAALDRSPENAHDRCQRARLDFLATPCKGTGEVYWQRAFRFWRALNGSSTGWDVAGAELDRAIARAIEMHEERTGRAAE